MDPSGIFEEGVKMCELVQLNVFTPDSKKAGGPCFLCTC